MKATENTDDRALSFMALAVIVKLKEQNLTFLVKLQRNDFSLRNSMQVEFSDQKCTDDKKEERCRLFLVDNWCRSEPPQRVFPPTSPTYSPQQTAQYTHPNLPFVTTVFSYFHHQQILNRLNVLTTSPVVQYSR